MCPAGQLDSTTLSRIFEAVGLNLPARLLVTAVGGSDSSGLSREELLSLGTALLAALSTDPDMAAHPQLLTTIPLLLGLGGAVHRQGQLLLWPSVRYGRLVVLWGGMGGARRGNSNSNLSLTLSP